MVTIACERKRKMEDITKNMMVDEIKVLERNIICALIESRMPPSILVGTALLQTATLCFMDSKGGICNDMRAALHKYIDMRCDVLNKQVEENNEQSHDLSSTDLSGVPRDAEEKAKEIIN